MADAYDVITSTRSYKEPMSHAAARRELVICAGAQFDPSVVRAFLNVSLGRRWTAGLLAAVSHLPLGHLGTAPAAVGVGAVVSAGALTVAAVPPPVEELAFDSGPTTTTEAVEPDWSTSPSVTLTAAADGTPVVEVEQADGDEEPTTTGTTVDATDQATAATTATTDTTTTTTTPTTTTTTAPPPAGTAYYLTHTEGWLAGSTEGMDPNAPTETVLGDYDDPEDGVAGMRLLPTAEGFESETDPRKVIAFVNSGVGGDTMNGPVAMTLWVATDSDLGGAPTTVAVDVADCNFGWFCTQLASTTAEVTTWVGNGYQPITVTLEPTTPHPFEPLDKLLVRVITEGSETLHLAYGTTAYPAEATVDVS